MRHFVFLVILFALLKSNKAFAQNGYGKNDTLIVAGEYYLGELVPSAYLEEVKVLSKLTKAQAAKSREYNRLRNAVYVTYPYARTAGTLLNDINAKLEGVTDKSQRRQIIMSREKELKKQFNDPITNLSVYQGKVLMKLINRETGNNCYEIIKEYRGSFSARVYQTVAFFFNSNLKQPYDPKNDDAVIESFVHEVQRSYSLPETSKRTDIL